MTRYAIRYSAKRKSKLMGELSAAQNLRAQAYFSEYQAMMTRMNWFMSMQFMPLVPLVAFFTVIAAVYSHFDSKVLVGWSAAWVTQLAILVYYSALHEVYNHALYIELNLKPKVAALLHLGTNSFWRWERHLKQFGKANNPSIGDLAPAAFSGIAFIVAAIIAIRRALLFVWSRLTRLRDWSD